MVLEKRLAISYPQHIIKISQCLVKFVTIQSAGIKLTGAHTVSFTNEIVELFTGLIEQTKPVPLEMEALELNILTVLTVFLI